MLRPVFLSLMLSAAAVPAMAIDIKQEVVQAAAAYEACDNKHDPVCVQAQYTKDGVQVDHTGMTNDLKTRYEGHFKGGLDHVVLKVSNVYPIDDNSAVAEGDATATIKTDKGDQIINLVWSNYFVREDGKMKVRISILRPKAEPAKEASADKK
jgi:hypothetical protein